MGSDYYETPNIDRIANEGMIFNDGYANCQVCSPSRASIMTGKFTARHGITDHLNAPTGEEWRKRNKFNKLLPPDFVRNLPHEYIVLPEALKEAGYKTFYAEKWHYPHYGNQGGEPSSIIRLGKWKFIHYYEDGREELYNLETDVEETTDLAGKNPEMVADLSRRLFTMLNEMGARYPEKDQEYSEELEQKHLEWVKNVRMPQLEKQRLEFLSKDFEPGNNWWGSQVED